MTDIKHYRDVTCLSVPTEDEYSIKYLAKYVDKAWIVTEDKDFIMEMMNKPGVEVKRTQVIESLYSHKYRTTAVEQCTGSANLFDAESSDATYYGNMKDKHQVYELNCPYIGNGTDIKYQLQKIVKTVKDTGDNVLINTCYHDKFTDTDLEKTKNFANSDNTHRGYKAEGPKLRDIKPVNKKAFNVDGVTIQKLRSDLYVAYPDTKAVVKAKRMKKRNFAQLKKEFCDYSCMGAQHIRVLKGKCDRIAAAALEEYYKHKVLPKFTSAEISVCDNHKLFTTKALNEVKKCYKKPLAEVVKEILKKGTCGMFGFNESINTITRTAAGLIYLQYISHEGIDVRGAVKDLDTLKAYNKLRKYSDVLEEIWKFLVTNRDKIQFFTGWGYKRNEDSYMLENIAHDGLYYGTAGYRTRNYTEVHSIGESDDEIRKNLDNPYAVKLKAFPRAKKKELEE